MEKRSIFLYLYIFVSNNNLFSLLKIICFKFYLHIMDMPEDSEIDFSISLKTLEISPFFFFSSPPLRRWYLCVILPAVFPEFLLFLITFSFFFFSSPVSSLFFYILLNTNQEFPEIVLILAFPPAVWGMQWNGFKQMFPLSLPELSFLPQT